MKLAVESKALAQPCGILSLAAAELHLAKYCGPGRAGGWWGGCAMAPT